MVQVISTTRNVYQHWLESYLQAKTLEYNKMNHSRQFRNPRGRVIRLYPGRLRLQKRLIGGEVVEISAAQIHGQMLERRRAALASRFFFLTLRRIQKVNYLILFSQISPASATLQWLGGLRVSVTLKAMLAGDSSPGRATQARQVEGQRPDKEHSLVLQVGGWTWANNLALQKNKTTYVTETATETSPISLVQEESSLAESMTCTSESPREAGVLTTLFTTKTKTRIGTWNIRTLYESSRAAQVSSEMHKYNLKVLGLCETRWAGLCFNFP